MRLPPIYDQFGGLKIERTAKGLILRDGGILASIIRLLASAPLLGIALLIILVVKDGGHPKPLNACGWIVLVVLALLFFVLPLWLGLTMAFLRQTWEFQVDPPVIFRRVRLLGFTIRAKSFNPAEVTLSMSSRRIGRRPRREGFVVGLRGPGTDVDVIGTLSADRAQELMDEISAQTGIAIAAPVEK